MTDLVLKTVFEQRGYTDPVVDGTIKIPGVSFDFEKVKHINTKMSAVCDLEYDLGEVTLTDYIQARSFGKPLVALPIFVNRNFMHNRIWYNVKSGIRTPKDLEGKRIGLKSYTQTAPFWNRGILGLEYGINWDTVTWTNTQPPHVKEYKNPPNVVPGPKGVSLHELLERGEIDAADDPGRPWSDRGEKYEPDPNVIRCLIPNGKQAEIDWFKRTGVYPIMHILVVKQEAVNKRPTLMRELFDAFVQAKKHFMENITDPKEYKLRGRDIAGRNFLPYGLDGEGNRKTLEMACQFCDNQKITPRRFTIEELFAPDVAALKE